MPPPSPVVPEQKSTGAAGEDDYVIESSTHDEEGDLSSGTTPASLTSILGGKRTPLAPEQAALRKAKLEAALAKAQLPLPTKRRASPPSAEETAEDKGAHLCVCGHTLFLPPFGAANTVIDDLIDSDVEDEAMAGATSKEQ